MRKSVQIPPTRFRRYAGWAGGLGLVVFFALATRAPAQSPINYRQMVARIPSNSNSVVIFNVQKILNSPLGTRDGWAKDLDKAFADGVSRVPPQSEGLVLAAQMDFSFVRPIWEAAVVTVREPLSLDEIAKRRSGMVDMLEGMRAVELPNDTYVIQLGSDTVGAMGPANRQMVLQWLREMKSGANISPYLQKAAGYVDDAGTEIIIAFDLEGAFAPEAIRAYLDSKPDLMKSANTTSVQAGKLLVSVQGARIGIRIGDKPFGKLVVDLGDDCSLSPEAGKALLLDVLADAGLKIADLAQWKADVAGKEFSLEGYLSESGLRRVFSLVNSPAPTQPPQEKAADVSPSSEKSQMATATLKQFQTITKMFNDLKQDWHDLTSLSAASIYFDRYAKRIENLPVLNVDPDMLKYRDFVASQLRMASGSVRTMGIRGGQRQSMVGNSATASAGANYGGYYNGYYGGGYRSGWSGGYVTPYGAVANATASTNAFHAQTRAQGAQRRAIRAEEKATMATDVQTIRSNVIDATNDTRRTMTQRYQVEF